MSKNKSPKTVQLGMTNMYPAPGIIERVGPDWDWIWIDGQHGQVAGYSELLAMVRACNLIQRPAFVRVPSHEKAWISLALDMNVEGIVVPQVESVEDAQRVVAAAKFPPLGDRSYGGRRPIDFHGRLYSNTANEDRKLICQIESEEALDQAETIASMPGVDGLFLGPDDLMLRKGFAMDQPRSKEMMTEVIRRLVSACEKHGKLPFTVAVGEEMISLCASLGVKYMISGGDVSFLANNSKTTSDQAGKAVAASPALDGSGSGNLEAKTVY